MDLTVCHVYRFDLFITGWTCKAALLLASWSQNATVRAQVSWVSARSLFSHAACAARAKPTLVPQLSRVGHSCCPFEAIHECRAPGLQLLPVVNRVVPVMNSPSCLQGALSQEGISEDEERPLGRRHVHRHQRHRTCSAVPVHVILRPEAQRVVPNHKAQVLHVIQKSKVHLAELERRSGRE